MRAVTGATTLREDTLAELDERVAELVQAMLRRAGVSVDAVSAVFLGATPDVTVGFPAAAARRGGLAHVPLLGVELIRNDQAPPRQVQLLAHLDGDGDRVAPVLLHGATLT